VCKLIICETKNRKIEKLNFHIFESDVNEGGTIIPND